MKKNNELKVRNIAFLTKWIYSPSTNKVLTYSIIILMVVLPITMLAFQAFGLDYIISTKAIHVQKKLSANTFVEVLNPDLKYLITSLVFHSTSAIISMIITYKIFRKRNLKLLKFLVLPFTLLLVGAIYPLGNQAIMHRFADQHSSTLGAKDAAYGNIFEDVYITMLALGIPLAIAVNLKVLIKFLNDRKYSY